MSIVCFFLPRQPIQILILSLAPFSSVLQIKEYSLQDPLMKLECDQRPCPVLVTPRPDLWNRNHSQCPIEYLHLTPVRFQKWNLEGNQAEVVDFSEDTRMQLAPSNTSVGW